MPDPFDVLRAPLTPVTPDPTFAAQLRARVERALSEPKGPIMTVATAPAPVPTATLFALAPYLAVSDARRAIDWYVNVFSARLQEEPIVMPDNRIGHAELAISGAVLMLADEFPEISVTAPRPGEGVPVSLRLEVADLDAMTERAASAGATIERPPTDNPYGRGATIVDPFGHRWLLATVPTPAAARYPNGTRHGDVGYISFEVPDLSDAMDFFGDVLGWRFSPGSADQGRQVEEVAPMTGLWGGQPRGLPVISWRVDDIAGAVERVRAAGGTATDPEQTPYGFNANCVDDQGSRFYLFQPTPEQAAAEADVSDAQRAALASQPGDLVYLTLEVQDSAKARAFYEAVLGWRFTPGPFEDGWSVEGILPMTGMSGGHEQATNVPIYSVPDAREAVERVRAAGGTSTEPKAVPYGISADCTDSHGTRFYILQ